VKKRLLIQVQLSNYDTHGKFILEADSNWQIWAWRSREMLKLNPELYIDLLIPDLSQIMTSPYDFSPEAFESGRLRLITHRTIPNAPATRYDFDMESYRAELELGFPDHEEYDAVFINDPALLPNFKALFFLYGKYVPKFFLQIHFVDHPQWSGRQKFPGEVSLWDRQVEAIRKADVNFWMCQPTADVVLADVEHDFHPHVVSEIKEHSAIWDDGYSQFEASRGYDVTKLRFTQEEFRTKTEGKLVIFAPNRVGGRGRTSDYTHIGEFLFEKLPKLRARRQDFVVIAGNPSQKFLNEELEKECGPNGYINIVPNAPNRDEYHYIASHSDVSVHLYDTEHHGGVASRECVEMGCLPLWTDCNEYSHMARAGLYSLGLCDPDRSDLLDVLDNLLNFIQEDPAMALKAQQRLREAVRNRCAYERTTPAAMKVMGLL
jgi:hypothetical protein